MGSLLQRFDQKWMPVPVTGCHVWTGAVTSKGYGKLAANRKWILAHRFSYEKTYGPFSREMLVCHSCDVPSCVNPDHLFLGTYADNAQDKENKNRGNHAYGLKHGRAKLTETDVLALRSIVASGEMSAYAAAKKFGVDPKTAKDIVSRKLWNHLP